jgi:hypothetical protein
MFLAGVGALSGLVFLSRAHDRSIAALDRIGNASPPKLLGLP